MKKIIKALLMTMIVTTLITVPSFADKVISQENVTAKIEALQGNSPIITKPKEKTYITSGDMVAMSGTGKEKDVVNVVIYTKSGSEYKLIDENTFEIGPLGVFTTEISLKYVGQTPKDFQISEETYVQLRITRGTEVIEDARIIKYTSDEKLQTALEALSTKGLKEIVN